MRRLPGSRPVFSGRPEAEASGLTLARPLRRPERGSSQTALRRRPAMNRPDYLASPECRLPGSRPVFSGRPGAVARGRTFARRLRRPERGCSRAALRRRPAMNQPDSLALIYPDDIGRGRIQRISTLRRLGQVFHPSFTRQEKGERENKGQNPAGRETGSAPGRLEAFAGPPQLAFVSILPDL
ncbi:MAG: hypothetical protein JJT96_08375 [Opitutales bacterium]|nr:hypothetical protein [Opitutales bacterium]